MSAGSISLLWTLTKSPTWTSVHAPTTNLPATSRSHLAVFSVRSARQRSMSCLSFRTEAKKMTPVRAGAVVGRPPVLVVSIQLWRKLTKAKYAFASL